MNNPGSKSLFFGIATAMLASIVPFRVHAASVSALPAILDYHAKARDIIEGSLTLKNLSSRQIDIYPVVNNIAASSGAESFTVPSIADLSSSLANWIQITRGMIELAPGESRAIPLEIRVNLAAKAGLYHALIAFPEGSSRADAEARLNEAATVTVNLEVQENIKENVQLKSFSADKNLFWGLPASFSYELKNSGNRAQTPTGDITIYDRRGKEVTTLIANKEGVALNPNDSHMFSNEWRGGAGIGQYKALINLQYGANNEKLQDTIFFWVITPGELAIIIAIFVFLLIGALLAFHSWYTRTYGGNPQVVSPRFQASHVVDLRPPGTKNKL